MRDFLMELYLKHGEREWRMHAFDFYSKELDIYKVYINAISHKFLEHSSDLGRDIRRFILTPKAIEYIKNLDNP